MNEHPHRRASLRRRRLAGLVGVVLLTCVTPLAGRAAEKGDKTMEAKLIDLEGGRVLLSELRGQPLLLKFWATWCLPCREQERIVAGLRGELEAAGFRILAVNEGEGRDVVQKFLIDTPTTLEVLLDRGQLLTARLRISSLPALAVLDADGRVIAVHRGLADRDEVLGLTEARPVDEEASSDP